MSEPAVVRVTRSVAAAPETVFDAWLDPDQLGRWMFGPAVRDEEIVHLALTPKKGGSFSFLVERDGENVEYVGKYLEISRPQRLAFTWTVATESVGSRVLVDIVAGEAGCELTLTQEIHSSRAEQVEHTEVEWSHMLDTLALVLGEAS